MMEYLTEGEDSQAGQRAQPGFLSFDGYLNHHLRNGPAQHKMCMSLFTMLFSEGSESIVLGLIIPVLVYEWNIDTFGKSMLITLVYVGVSLGSALQTVADHFGRYSIISLAAIIQTAAGLMSAIAGEFSFFLFMRFIYGIGIGIVLPLSATFVSEITPTAERARQLIYSRIIWNLGTILTCLLSYFLLDGFEEQASSWRLLLLIVCLPGVLALYFHFVHGRESPRYLLLKGKYQQAKKIMSEMEILNEVQQLPKQDFEALKKWAAKQEQTHGMNIPFSKLVDIKYRWITLKLVISWFTVCFVYYGTMLLLPLILYQNFAMTNKSNYITISIVSIFQLFAMKVSVYLMDHPEFGRKKTIQHSFMSCAIASVILFLFQLNHILFSLLFVAIKFSITLAFMTLYPYTAELYPTLLRSKAMGITSLSGRLATILLGVVGVYALELMGGKLLYLIFMAICLISYFAINAMPYDTLGKDLDHH